jgi:hypothetical protein
LIGPKPVWFPNVPWFGERPAIFVQNRTTNIVPMVRAITPKNVTTVAAWVRCISAEMKRPSEPSPIAEAKRTT